jgi:hypothetical protein
MKPQFTPGPFPLKITQSDDFFVIITNQGNHYAKTFDPAAAHLIASAPDLLSALERLAHPMADDDDLDFARAIIAKAKGLSVKYHE